MPSSGGQGVTPSGQNAIVAWPTMQAGGSASGSEGRRGRSRPGQRHSPSTRTASGPPPAISTGPDTASVVQSGVAPAATTMIRSWPRSPSTADCRSSSGSAAAALEIRSSLRGRHQPDTSSPTHDRLQDERARGAGRRHQPPWATPTCGQQGFRQTEGPGPPTATSRSWHHAGTVDQPPTAPHAGPPARERPPRYTARARSSTTTRLADWQSRIRWSSSASSSVRT